MPTASPSSLSLLCCLLLLFSSYKYSWGNFSILVALATTSNQKTGGSKAIVSSTKFHASHFPVPTGTLEKAMAPHSSTLAWKIPRMEEPGGLQFMGSLELDTTERLHFDISLSCIGEGNGNPLQCSCLENPREGKPGGLPSMGSHRVGHD